jgi:hypothetical protein
MAAYPRDRSPARCPRKATAAYIADERMGIEKRACKAPPSCAPRARTQSKSLTSHRLLHGQRRRARQRMANIRMAMLEAARSRGRRRRKERCPRTHAPTGQ